MENEMPLTIAGTYKVGAKIGSGGASVIYLAEHMRLGKNVALKADKRTLSANPENLRREVETLKNLSHSYIPQVYDFIVEEGVVYTVMDYIEGESLDKPLKRGERFPQAQVAKWACQLLEAVVYLHGRPPHGILHADIKPANVMMTPENNICLIDFNIALALGAKGAVAVGRSAGYASPEHYGLDYSAYNVTRSVTAASGAGTESLKSSSAVKSSAESVAAKKPIILDVRSDIYGLGATLYHIMTGERPAKYATEVKPISAKEYSLPVIRAIEKAMHPDPDLRYQSAGEMLRDFERLREDDPRVKRRKRAAAITTAALSLSFIAGGLTAFTALRLNERLQGAYALAEYSENALDEGDAALAVDYALQALTKRPDAAEAQKALTDALNVYDLSDGFKKHKTIELPSAPLYMAISPGGKTAAAVYAYDVAVFDTETAEIIATLPAEKSALSEVEYISEDIIIYAGENGIKAYNISERKGLWSGKPATNLTVSADGGTVAAAYKDENFATIYDVKSGVQVRQAEFDEKRQKVVTNDSFANPGDDLFALNGDGSSLGVSFADGSLWIYDLTDAGGQVKILDGALGYTSFDGGFFDGYFAFSASKKGSSEFSVIDTVTMERTGGFESVNPFSAYVDSSGVYMRTENILVNIDPATGEQTPIVNISESISRFARDEEHTLISAGNEHIFFDKNAVVISRYKDEYADDIMLIAKDTAVIGGLNSPVIRVMKREDRQGAEAFAYDPSYEHDEARISADGKTVMLFSFKQFRLYDINGGVIADVSIPGSESLYDQRYLRDENGSRLENIYYDGTIRAYSAENGELSYETKGENPDTTLYEEFFTDKLMIESPLHGTPAAYDRKSGELVRELEKDAYLTYVTQVGEMIITEYITADGERYGLALNEKCETLARLPYLCDIIGDELVFDYPNGRLRKSRLYDIDELVELAGIRTAANR
ncbi:MAG: protein kinase [Clostridiales bacterium]|jgi:predicted Ser/Thr protein kinase|nr:protein kinase [Clostridiales bacterium]